MRENKKSKKVSEPNAGGIQTEKFPDDSSPSNDGRQITSSSIGKFFLQLQTTRGGVVVIATGVWLLLLLWHANVLFDPVYWDTILGSFHQAIWLKNHGFNQYFLCTSMPPYLLGGPKIYTTSIYPLVQAVFMTWIPDRLTFFFVNHLVQFGFATCFLLAIWLLAIQHLTVFNACGIALAVGTIPIFHSMSSTINMDLPCAALSILGLLFYFRRQFVWMILVLVLAALVKQSAAVVIIAITFMMWIRIKNRFDFLYAVLMAVPLLFAFSPQLAAFIEPKPLRLSETTMHVSEWIFKPSLIGTRIKDLFSMIPDHIVVLLAAFAVSIIYLAAVLVIVVITWFSNKRITFGAIQTAIMERESGVLNGAVIIGFTLLYFAMSVGVPRYIIWIIPYVFLFLVAMLCRFPRVLLALSLCIAAMNLVNQNGMLYRMFERVPAQGYAHIRERSMEYRDDMLANLELTKFVEENLSETHIVTFWPITHMLAAPEFGYVQAPLSVVSVNGAGLMGLNVPYFMHANKRFANNPRPIVFITTQNNFSGKIDFDPNIHQLIKEIVYQDRVFWIYQIKSSVIPGS